jgi:hypothetical protein
MLAIDTASVFIKIGKDSGHSTQNKIKGNNYEKIQIF